ncbi:hypothetical protein Tco_0379847, partial [Tanacetum coccineum]
MYSASVDEMECPDNMHDLRLRMLLVPWWCLSDTKETEHCQMYFCECPDNMPDLRL